MFAAEPTVPPVGRHGQQPRDHRHDPLEGCPAEARYAKLEEKSREQERSGTDVCICGALHDSDQSLAYKQLIDTCIKNGGDHFLAEIASKEFVDEVSSVIKNPVSAL